MIFATLNMIAVRPSGGVLDIETYSKNTCGGTLKPPSMCILVFDCCGVIQKKGNKSASVSDLSNNNDDE